MQRTVLARSRILVLAAMSCSIPGLCADQPVHADVKDAVATPDQTGDPDAPGFKVRFGLRLTNRSGEQLELPTSGTGNNGVTRIELVGMDAKRPDGRWAPLLRSSWYDTGTIKYEPCGPLPPGGVAEFTDLASGFLLLKRQLAGLGKEPTVRFNLMMFCRRPDGKVVTKTVTTEGFALHLPARP